MLHLNNTSYAVDPREVAELLASNLPEPTFDTGLIPVDILRVHEKGKKRVVIGYRKPKMTGIWLEGVSDALHVPMPGLLIARVTTNNYQQVQYSIVAVTEKPNSDTPTYNCPLPNTSNEGTGVCWGNVPKPPKTALRSLNLSEDWTNFLGSHFGSHAVPGKSKLYKDNIRKQLEKLAEDKAKVYPIDDLIDRKQSFMKWMEKLCQ